MPALSQRPRRPAYFLALDTAITHLYGLVNSERTPFIVLSTLSEVDSVFGVLVPSFLGLQRTPWLLLLLSRGYS